MTEITLAQYTGFLFQEIVKAREMADAYSRAVADRYSRDDLLSQLPAPRFKLPKVTLSIPMAISAADVAKVERLDMTQAEFERAVMDRLDKYVSAAVLPNARRPRSRNAAPPIIIDPRVAVLTRKLIQDLYNKLSSTTQLDADLSTAINRLFESALAEKGQLESYKKKFPGNDLGKQLVADVADSLKGRFVLDGARLHEVKVTPETDAVRTRAGDTAVFMVVAEMVEEGFYLRNLKSDNGTVQQVVELD